MNNMPTAFSRHEGERERCTGLQAEVIRVWQSNAWEIISTQKRQIKVRVFFYYFFFYCSLGKIKIIHWKTCYAMLALFVYPAFTLSGTLMPIL